MASLVQAATPPRWDLDYERLAGDLRPLGSATRVRLLNFLTIPRYVEEIATFLNINRYAAKKHVDQLVARGHVLKAPAQRPQGLVVEYRLSPEKLFELFDSMRALSTLRPNAKGDREQMARTKPVASRPDVRPAKRGPPRVVVMYGVQIGRQHELLASGRENGWTIGRDATCQVRIDADPFVSARHARLDVRAGRFEVTDLFSTNGTTLEWEPVPPGTSHEVENGHVIGVGKTLLLFRSN